MVRIAAAKEMRSYEWWFDEFPDNFRFYKPPRIFGTLAVGLHMKRLQEQ